MSRSTVDDHGGEREDVAWDPVRMLELMGRTASGNSWLKRRRRIRGISWACNVMAGTWSQVISHRIMLDWCATLKLYISHGTFQSTACPA